MVYSFSDILIPYSEKNSDNLYEPVAVGKYGIRKRSDIYKKELSDDYTKNKVIHKDTLTIGMGSKQIDFGVLKDNEDYSVSPAYKTFKINTSIIMSSYLDLYLMVFNHYLTQKYMIASARQGKKVDVENFLKEKINVPNFEIQTQTVKNINSVRDIIDLNQKYEQILDEYIVSYFYELFGDPVFNQKRWTTLPLEEACAAIVDCPHSTPKYTDENTGFMCIRTSIVKKNNLLWDDIEYIQEDEYYTRIKRKKPEKGDVVYTREGGILGIDAIIDRDCNVALGQRSMLLSPDYAKCNSEFLSVAMNFDSFLTKALKDKGGSASPHINVGDIRNFCMIIPPIELQNTFSIFYREVMELKNNIRKRNTLYEEFIEKNMSENINK